VFKDPYVSEDEEWVIGATEQFGSREVEEVGMEVGREVVGSLEEEEGGQDSLIALISSLRLGPEEEEEDC